MSSGVLSGVGAAVPSVATYLLFTNLAEEDTVAIVKYLESIEPVRSPYLASGKLSAAAQRGKRLFFNATVNCAKCHPQPLFTDMLMHDVGSRGQYDRRDAFDTPTLIECWRTAPYMHDGRYSTLKNVFVQGEHGPNADNMDKLTEQQILDLIEFVLSL
jgi:cytochrome c peroxidase